MLVNAKILVADDDAELLSVVAQALEASGAAVVCASSGAELMEALADEGPFALVVTDVSMPWMDGLQAMFSARHAGLATPVLVMTGLNDEGVANRIRALEPKVFLLRKPFDLEALTRAAERLLTTYPPGAPDVPDAAEHNGVAADSNAAEKSVAGANVKWLETLFDSMAEAIVVVDPEGHVVTANRAAKDQFFGTFGDQNEFDDPLTVELQRPSGERLRPDELAAEHDGAELGGGGKSQGPHDSHDQGLLLRCADGTVVPVRVHATSIRTEEQSGTVLVLDRASQAPDDTAARTEWATAIAHDLRQPINSIMLTSDLLLQGDMAEDQRQHLLRVRSSAKRLSRMVGDMAKLAGQTSSH